MDGSTCNYCPAHTQTVADVAVLRSENLDIKQDIRNNMEWRNRIERKIDNLKDLVDSKTTPISNKLWLIVGGANALMWAVGICVAIYSALN